MMRRLIVGAVLIAAVSSAPASSQTFAYLAFGDSITRGKCDGSCDHFNAAGYPTRLESLLSCSGSVCSVDNKGKDGEFTSAGVTRVETVLDSKAYDVMLLMHGTNDIWHNISNNTIKSNLGQMENKARLRGVDTVHASIIRWHPNGVNGTSQDADVADLRNKVADLASAGNGYFVDTWSVLCPTLACFNTHYAPIPPDNGLHPDSSGYDIMAGEFRDEILSQPVPGAPTPTTPGGDVTAPTTFNWNRESPQVATWYHVSIDGPSGNLLSHWYRAQDYCTGSSCSITVGLGWTAGDHSWRVRGRNPRGRSSWSADQGFRIYTTPPGAATTASPQGDIYSAAPPSITYEWTGVADATQYQLKVQSGSGVVIDRTDAAGTVCSGTACEVTPPASLTGGDYSWTIVSSNPAGAGPESTPRAFTIFDSVPAQAVAGYPDREILNDTPQYQWTAVAGATEYDVEVQDGGGSTVVSETFGADVCTGTLCAAMALTQLAVDDHTWTVTARNPLGDGPTSSAVAFTLLGCSSANVELENETVTTSETIQACESITAGNLGAGDYRIGASGHVVLHAGKRVEIRDGLVVDLGGVLEIRSDP